MSAQHEREVRRDKGGKWLPGHSPKSPGRPRAIQPDDETVAQVERLASIQCTKAEASAVLGVSRDGFNALLDGNERAQVAWEEGLEKGKASLRRMQWKKAEDNPTMQIWLGKQYLGQRDRSEIGLPSDYERLTDEQLIERQREIARQIKEIEDRTGGSDAGEDGSPE